MLAPQEINGIWGSPIIAVVIFVVAFVTGVAMVKKNINNLKTIQLCGR